MCTCALSYSHIVHTIVCSFQTVNISHLKWKTMKEMSREAIRNRFHSRPQLLVLLLLTIFRCCRFVLLFIVIWFWNLSLNVTANYATSTFIPNFYNEQRKTIKCKQKHTVSSRAHCFYVLSVALSAWCWFYNFEYNMWIAQSN